MRPKFRVGDIVSSIGDSNELYVVREFIYREDVDKHLYDVSPLLVDDNGTTDDNIYTYCESSLEFQYHDTQWEKYFTESNRESQIITNDEAFFEMAGRLPRDKSGRCKLVVAVGGNERNIAHFHVFRSEEDLRAWRNSTCLYFEENKYYDHCKNQETLTRDELKIVVNILKSTHNDLGIMNWRYLVSLWNYNNDMYQIDINTPMPDYDYKTITRYKEKDIIDDDNWYRKV